MNRVFYSFFAIVCIFIAHALYLECIAEDSFIAYRYSRNLANGHGFVWNIGEPPVEGYTNFSWVVLGAIALKFGVNIVLFSKIVGGFASLVTLAFTYKYSDRLLGCDKLFALIPCFLLAVSGPFATWSLSGMETNFFGMLMLLGCYYWVSYKQFKRYRDLLLSASALLMATLTRPEGLLVFSTLLGVSLFASDTGFKHFMRTYGLPLCIYVIPLSIYCIWRLKFFGFLLPNPYYAKVTGIGYLQFRGLVYSSFFMMAYVSPLLLVLLLSVWEKGFPPFRLKGTSMAPIRESAETHFGAYAAWAVAGIYTLYIIYVGGDYMAMYRFFVPLLPLIYILFGGAIYTLQRTACNMSHKKVVLSGILTLVVFATLLQSTPLEARLFARSPFQHGTFRGVQIERWHVSRLSLIGRFFEQYKVNNNASLATRAIGAISFYADMKIYDVHGLVDPYIAHKKMDQSVMGLGFPGHEKSDLLYTFSKRPTYFMFNRSLTKEPMDYPQFPDDVSAYVRQHYIVKSVWLVDKDNVQEGYFSFLEISNSAMGKQR